MTYKFVDAGSFVVYCVPAQSLRSLFDVAFQTNLNTLPKHVDRVVVVIDVAT